MSANAVDILVVEDSRLQAKQLKALFDDHGYRTVIAYDGIEGLQSARAHNPSLVLTDIVMPNMDGFEMCRQLREDTSLNGLRVLVLTSLSNPEDILRGLEAGADSYATKPYDPAVLLARVEELLNAPQRPPDEDNCAEIRIAGARKTYCVSAPRHRILGLLLSTYEDAVSQNQKLREAQAKLVTVNATLEQKVSERTSALQGEIAERKRMEKQLKSAIQELKAARDALQFKATHDGLTRHWNRSAIMQILENELARSDRQGTPVSVIIMDIDHFKEINDVHGHLAGDAVLRGVAQRLVSAMRPYDSIGRYGGEEFLVVLPGCDRSQVFQVADRLRQLFAAKPIQTPEGRFRITLSFGTATLDGTASRSIDAIVRAADHALYKAKTAGRNRIEMWDEQTRE
jgi:diguanylate cyclase (GGDEF)-like protein